MRKAILARWAALILALAGANDSAGQAREPDLDLRGSITGAQNQTYVEAPFTVPAGVERITVEFAYSGRDQRTTIDLGLADPQRFRGWSGGNKSRFVVGEVEATPSYLPGPLPAGRWRLVLGVPNIRAGVHSTYEAKIWFDRKGSAFAGLADKPLSEQPGWRRGDFHMHTGHSDGFCAPQPGAAKVPCPVYRTLEAASARGLDFIAITDHNATSQFEALRELQPAFPSLLLIPGREVTTFAGHANVFGLEGPLDFGVEGRTGRPMNRLIGEVVAQGGLFSINHPAMPSGESCMGCGWTVKDTDWSRVAAMEVINGGAINSRGGQVETELSAIPLWESLLNRGFHITAIGGSDNHDATLPPATPSAIGYPTTVVWASELSQSGVLAGVRSGRAFIDVDGEGRSLEMTATAFGQSAAMGGTLRHDGVVKVAVRLGAMGGRIELVQDGVRSRPLGDLYLERAEGAFEAKTENARSWIRIDVRDGNGRLVVIGNPIWLERAG